MNLDQFSALSALLGGSSQQVREALRLVLVEGMRQADAARQAGVTRQALNRRMRRAAKIMGLARRLIGVTADTAAPAAPQDCECLRCTRERGDTVNGFPVEVTHMFACSICGNKRCPHSDDHRNQCIGSNEPGQAAIVTAMARRIAAG